MVEMQEFNVKLRLARLSIKVLEMCSRHYYYKDFIFVTYFHLSSYTILKIISRFDDSLSNFHTFVSINLQFFGSISTIYVY